MRDDDLGKATVEDPHTAAAQTDGAEAEELTQQVGRSAAMMSGLVVISRVTGFFRTWAQAFALGTSLLSSCYTVANNLPNQLYELVIGGMIMTAFLPVYLSVKEKSGREGANRYVSNLLSIVLVLMGLLTVLCIAFAAPIIFTQSVGTDQAQMADAVWFFRFFACEVLLYCLSQVCSGVLNAERDYFWSNAAPIFNNFITIASFLLYAFFAQRGLVGVGMLCLAVGNPLGVLVQVLLQLPSLRRHGVRLTPHIDFHDPALKETLSIGVPTLVATVCTFVTTAVMTSSALVAVPDQGSSVVYYARLWYTLPYAVLAVPITVTMFTELSDMYAKGDMDGYARTASEGICQVIFVLIPFMVYLIAFAQPLMSLLQIGRFDEKSVELTAYYLRFLALILPWYGVQTLLQKVFSSLRRMVAMAVANVIISLVQVVFTVVMTPVLGIAAVALGSLVYFVLLDGFSFVFLRSYLGHTGLRRALLVAARSLALGIVGALLGMAVMYLLRTVAGPAEGSLVRSLVYLVPSGVVAVVVTYGAAMRLHLPEAAVLGSLVGRVLRRRAA